MPPVSPQGSRTALITWSVVCSVLFVTATIFAIYFYVSGNEATEQRADIQRRFADVVAEGDLTGPKVTDLTAFRTTEGAAALNVNAQMPALDVALAQRDALARLVGGTGADAGTALASATKTLQSAAGDPALKSAGVTVPTTDNMALAVQNLAQGLKARLQQIADLNTQLKQAKDAQAQDAKQMQASIDEMNKTVDAIRAQAAQQEAELAKYREERQAEIQTLTQTVGQGQQQATAALQQAEVQLRERDQQIEALTKEAQRLRERLGVRRVDAAAPVIRQPDGQIVRVPNRNTVFIDLGQGDSVMPGLTFEVYDRNEGIPQTATANTATGAAPDEAAEEPQPEGKASVEVLRVGPTSSECRVTRIATGAVLSEGDLIANLVYDRNTKYNFLVYGDFDIDNNGVATPNDADVVRRLITQWGGSLTDQVNVDTDFVVLGKEPVLKIYTAEERQDPFIQKQIADETAALEAYDKVRQRAAELRIPILNQNRFLYLVGYYNQATR